MLENIKNRLSNLKKEEKGFTLIELIVVIAVLGLLATIIVPRVINVKSNAEKAILEANEQIIKNALERYYAENGEYPDDHNTGKLPEEELKEYLDTESIDIDEWIYERKGKDEYSLTYSPEDKSG